MTVNECAICGLEISSLDRYSGRVVEMKNREVHSWCRVIKMGIVPECPLYNNITPKPCSNECVQARKCTSEEICNCKCENLLCQIGVSVRELRAKGMMPWQGYIPMKLRQDALQAERENSSELNEAGSSGNVDWRSIYQYLTGLSSHGVYTLESVADELKKCGLEVKVLPMDAGLRLAGHTLAVSEPDYGSPGIWSLRLAYKLYAIATGSRFHSQFSGRGYQYRDVLERMEKWLETSDIARDSE